MIQGSSGTWWTTGVFSAGIFVPARRLLLVVSFWTSLFSRSPPNKQLQDPLNSDLVMAAAWRLLQHVSLESASLHLVLILERPFPRWHDYGSNEQVIGSSYT